MLGSLFGLREPSLEVRNFRHKAPKGASAKEKP